MTALSRSNFWDKDIQRYLTATDIRIRLEYPWTDGNHNFPQEQFLNQYYYDITNVDINGRCHCNGHGQFCEGDLSKLVCRCLHNTEGIDCERCKPLYNNRTWMAASSSTETNPCQSKPAYSWSKLLENIFNCFKNVQGYLYSKCEKGQPHKCKDSVSKTRGLLVT